MVKEGLTRGTNIGDTTLSVINKELNNRVQGIVVFTDGRNTEGSSNAFADLAQRAKAARIPIFVVSVGEDRPKVKIDIVDLRLPPQIQPEDRFRTVVELTGEGLAGQKLNVTLEITHVRAYKVKTKDKAGKVVEEEKEEPLAIELIEKEDPDNPKSVRQKIPLGTKLTIKPAGRSGRSTRRTRPAPRSSGSSTPPPWPPPPRSTWRPIRATRARSGRSP